MSAGVFVSPYPVVLDLADASVLVVGAGEIGAQKASGLVDAGARVTVVAPTAGSEVANNARIRWHQRPYRRGEVASYRIAIAATDDPAVNTQIAHDADAANVFVNSVDDPGNCTFILPAIARAGDLQVAVSTNGRSPAIAKWVRRRIEQTIITSGRLLDAASDVRDELRSSRGSSEDSGWEQALDDALLEVLESGSVDGVRARLRSALQLADLSHAEGLS